jgi:ribosomal protein L37AE/L43A
VLKTYQTDRPVNAALIHPNKEHILLGGGQDAMNVTTTGGRVGKFETRFFHMVRTQQQLLYNHSLLTYYCYDCTHNAVTVAIGVYCSHIDAPHASTHPSRLHMHSLVYSSLYREVLSETS